MAQIEPRRNKKGEITSYRIRAFCGYTPDGKKVSQSMTWKPEKEMTEKQRERALTKVAVEFEAKCKTGKIVNAEKFQTFCENTYFPNYADRTMKPSGIERCHSYTVRAYEYLGHIRLDRITPREIDGFIAWLGKQQRITDATAMYKGDDLKALLKAKGFTQKAFAEKAGVSPQTVKAAMNKKLIKQVNAQKIADALEKNYSECFSTQNNERLLDPKTIKNYVSFVSSVFEYAVHLRLIKENPCKNAALPKARKKELKMLKIEEAKRFLDILDSEETPIKYRAFFHLAIFGGFRRGEILGLEWNDIDFEHNIVHIRRAAHRSKKLGYYDTDPKSNSSFRTLTLPAPVIFAIKQLQNEQLSQRLKLGDQWHDTNRLFTTCDGQQMNGYSPFAWLRKICKKYDLPTVNIHSFRHLNASLLISQGTDVKTVQSVLGHSQASTTLDIYAAAFQEREAQALGAVASSLLNNNGIKQA